MSMDVKGGVSEKITPLFYLRSWLEHAVWCAFHG